MSSTLGGRAGAVGKEVCNRREDRPAITGRRCRILGEQRAALSHQPRGQESFLEEETAS